MNRHTEVPEHVDRFALLPNPPTGGTESGLLSVVMPCFNEAGTLREIIQQVLAQSVVAELIIVDDGSTDETWDLIHAWVGQDDRVRFFRHPLNLGKGAALRSGFAAATAPLLLVQDADLEYDPSDYLALVEPILRNEADVVYGSRFLNEQLSRSSWWHRAENRMLTLFSNWLTGLHLTDEATCYKLFRKELLSGLELQEDGFGFCPEFTAKLARKHIRFVEVPVRYHARSHIQGKKLRLRHGWEAVRCLLKYTLGDQYTKRHGVKPG